MDDSILRTRALAPLTRADSLTPIEPRARGPRSRSGGPRPLAGGCMDVASLRYFRQIARVGSMSGAARDLGLTQPSLSTSMRRLEEDLGATLFVRHRGGVTLTESGAALMRHTDEVFIALERASLAVHGLERELIGALVIGCSDAHGHFLPRLYPDLLQGAPQLEVSLRNEPSEVIQAEVLERRIHFGVVVNPTPHPDLVMVPIFRDATELFVAAGAEPSELAQAQQQLRERPLILVDRSPQRSMLGALAEQGVEPSRVIGCDDFELVAKLTLAGVGVGVLPRRTGLDPRSGLASLHTELPRFVDDVVLVHRADLPGSRAATFVKESVIRCGRELPMT